MRVMNANTEVNIELNAIFVKKKIANEGKLTNLLKPNSASTKKSLEVGKTSGSIFMGCRYTFSPVRKISCPVCVFETAPGYILRHYRQIFLCWSTKGLSSNPQIW